MEILRVQPRNDMVLNLLGMVYFHQNDFPEAKKYLQKAIEVSPQPQYYKDLGDLYLKCRMPNDAIQEFVKGLELDPQNADINLSLGLAYADMKQFEKAVAVYKVALATDPACEEVVYNLGVALYELHNLNDAIACYMKTLELNPRNANAYQALGVAMYDLNRLEDSEKCYLAALSIDPDYIDAAFGLSYVYLKGMNFDKGWELYEHRFNKTIAVALPDFKSPRWDGSDITGKKLFVFLEQGLGDALMFSRYLPVLRDKGVQLVAWVYKPLRSLFEANFPYVSFVDEIESLTEDDYDFYIPAMSLPHVMRTQPDTIPYPNGYIQANAEKVEWYNHQFFNNKELKVGLVWQCKNKYPKDANRSVADVRYFEPLTRLEGIKLYSFQKGEGETQLENLPDGFNIENVASTFNDFDDTAAAIMGLDLVISVDTSVLHLAGALNKPTLLLLPFDSDWKWFMDLDSTPWYNCVKIFKQSEMGNWNTVIENVARELALLCVKGKDE